jgi:hypothetical protein
MAHEMSPAKMAIGVPGMPGTGIGLVPQHCTEVSAMRALA